MKKSTQPKPVQILSRYAKSNEVLGFYFDNYIVNAAWSW